MAKSNTISVGNCGEYFVAAELERRGFSVAVPMSNTELFDILAYDRETGEQWVIQVKTTQHKDWTLNKKSENIMGDRIVYVFVKLNGLEQPQYHIVPSADVAKSVKESHQLWLATPGKKGQQHNDNSMRKFSDSDNKYLDNWGILRP